MKTYQFLLLTAVLTSSLLWVAFRQHVQNQTSPSVETQSAEVEGLLFDNKIWQQKIQIKNCQIYFEKQRIRKCVIGGQLWKETTTFDLRQLAAWKMYNDVSKLETHDFVLLFFSNQTVAEQKLKIGRVRKLPNGKVDMRPNFETDLLAGKQINLPSRIIQLCSGENRVAPISSVGESFRIESGQGNDFVDSIYRIRSSCE